MLPPSSPDINPMDFTIWSILESDVPNKSYSRVDDQKNALLSTWSALALEVVLRSCYSATSRLELMVTKKEIIFKSDCCNILAMYT